MGYETDNTNPLNPSGVELEQTKAALRFYEERFVKAFRCTPTPISIARLEDGRYLEVNDAWLEATGYERHEVIGRTDYDVNIWANIENRHSLLKVFLKTGTVRGLEIKYRRKNGKVRTASLSADILTMGEDPCILAVANDISDRIHFEEALREANNELENRVQRRTEDLMAANEELQAMNQELIATIEQLTMTQQQLLISEKMASLGNLVAGVAHEVSTPVGVAVTTASHLQQITSEVHRSPAVNSLPAQFQEYLEDCREASQIILKNLERAAVLLRSFKQVSVDQSSEVKRVFNVKEYLDEILISLHPKLKKTRLKVVVNCDKNLLINSYPGAFAQIITNFIMNSLLHAYDPENAGIITIDVCIVQDQLEVQYADDGKGMKAAVLNRIFDPFFTTKRASGGTGLGLHIVYNIITLQLGGSVECQSEPDKGTRFIFHFPL